MPLKQSSEPTMATWRNVKRRNMGPLSRPVQADTAGLVLIMVVTWLLDMPSVMSRSRNMKPNCCRHGYSESCKRHGDTDETGS